MRQYYTDKTILLTGCTGFLGKVILEKIFMSLDCVKMVYLAITPTYESKNSEFKRLQEEIVDS